MAEWTEDFLSCVHAVCGPECPVPEGPWDYACTEHSQQVAALWEASVHPQAVTVTWPASKKRVASAGYVYVIGPADLEPGVLVKVGSTVSPGARLKDLQTGSPVHLIMHVAIPSSDCRALETQIHHRLASVRAHGEWFRYGPGPARLIEQAHQRGYTHAPTRLREQA